MSEPRFKVGNAVWLRIVVDFPGRAKRTGPYIVSAIRPSGRLTLDGSAAGRPEISEINPTWCDPIEKDLAVSDGR